MTDRLAQIQARVDRAPVGPHDLDADPLAVHARTDVPALLAMVRERDAALERVRELHQPVMEDGRPVGCALCDWHHDDGITWPCGTLAAITATEGAE